MSKRASDLSASPTVEESLYAELDKLRSEHTLMAKRLNQCHLIIIRQAREIFDLKEGREAKVRGRSAPKRLFDVEKEPKAAREKRQLPDLKVFTQNEVKRELKQFEEALLHAKPSLYKQLKKEVTRLKRSPQLSGEAIDLLVDDFAFQAASLFKNSSSEGNLEELSHNYIYEVFHPIIFQMTDDEVEKSLQIKEKIGVIKSKISPKMLGLREEKLAEQVVEACIAELSKLNALKSPRMKVKLLRNTVDLALRPLIRSHRRGSQRRSPVLSSSVPHGPGQPGEPPPQHQVDSTASSRSTSQKTS